MESPKTNGYEKLAGLMSKHGEVAAFQRFDFLNMLNILFLQAELVHLEEELKESMKADLESADNENMPILDQPDPVGSGDEIEEEEEYVQNDDEDRDKKIPLSRMNTKSTGVSESSVNERVEAGRDWWYLANYKPKDGSCSTWEIMLKTRTKLQEYNEAILRAKEMKAQDSPNSCDVDFLRRWFTDKKMGNFPLIGKDRNVWSASEPSELISLKRRTGDDPMSSLFLSKAFIWWHRGIAHIWKKPRDEEAQYFEYADDNVLRAANVVGSILSSGLLIGSIMSLYFAKSMLVRLGIVAGFTQTFSLVLILATNAKKIEVFAATAAFVAVLVVFVGSTTPRG